MVLNKDRLQILIINFHLNGIYQNKNKNKNTLIIHFNKILIVKLNMIYHLIQKEIILILILKMVGDYRSKNLKDNSGIQDLIIGRI